MPKQKRKKGKAKASGDQRKAAAVEVVAAIATAQAAADSEATPATSAPESTAPPQAVSDAAKPPAGPAAAPHIPRSVFIRVEHWALGVTVFVTALAVLWTWGVLQHSRITIGNRVVSSSVSDDTLRQLVAAQAANYRLRLQYAGAPAKVYSLRDLGVRPDVGATVQAIRHAQRRPQHALVWWRPLHAELVLAAHSPALGNFIATKATVVTKEPRNASLHLDNGKIVVTPELDGRQYGFANATRSLLAAARQLQPAPLQLQPLTRKPAVTSATLQPAKERLERILHQHITVTVQGQTITPSATNIGTWIKLTPTPTSVDVRLDVDQLRGYLATQAEEHSQAPRSEVISDATGEILVKGRAGVHVSSTDDALQALQSTVLNAGGAKLSLPAAVTAYKTVHAPTAGKWIEVDLATKHMYAYDQGEVVHSFLVTAGAPGTPTVTGRFAIYAKYAAQDMFGENLDGSRYFQPDVPYINYFYRDYAIHGNYWRPASYFGYINSSHGCVGVTVNEGAWIYSWAPIGTPVIVHS